MTHTVFFTRFIAITTLIVGFLFLATHVSVAAPLVPVVVQPTTPIYVGAENQVRSGPLGILISNFLGGTGFEVSGNSRFDGGLSILTNPIVINGNTQVGDTNSNSRLNIIGGNLTVSDAGQQVDGFSPYNIQVASLADPSISPICAEQSGKLIRC